MRAAMIAVSTITFSLLARPALAQTQGPGFAGPSVQSLEATAALRPAFASESTAPLTPMAVQSGQTHHGSAVALMIVGVAGMVTGIIIDEDVVTVAGAVAAGVGLYLYLK